MNSEAVPLLSLKAITKRFPGVLALDNVNLEVRSGEVHAIVGENGAGKSTLVKIIAGAYRPDAGNVRVAGAETRWKHPSEAIAGGIAVVYQESQIYPSLSIAENILMGNLPRRRGGVAAGIGLLNRRTANDRAAELLLRLGEKTPPTRLAGGLGPAGRQLIEIARALSLNARILVLDEPTASLGAHETDQLFAVIEQLKRDGLGIIFISHHLPEIFRIADRVSVFRDGRSVFCGNTRELDEKRLVELMAGREVTTLYPRHRNLNGAPGLKLDALDVPGLAGPVSLEVRSGEVVSLAGLVGSGRSELAWGIMGLRRPAGGAVWVEGRHVKPGDPAAAIEAGIAYVPEDRQNQGLAMQMDVEENLTLAILKSLCRGPFLSLSARRNRAAELMKRFDVRAASIKTGVGSLSGGNQQKVVVGRWLAREPKVLILDEPTKGIDVAAKAEIHKLMDCLAGDGMAVLMISSDLPEALAMGDRVLVMRGGRVAAELSHEEASEEKTLAAMLGVG
ncbi:MAG TPA: sugar ABC transporter ATP-binding protein [Candidatus Brocadiia bacterium]|nr:sugar ABC transporter ATP-binding protein [Candidatus Brocadiia bacterium]